MGATMTMFGNPYYLIRNLNPFVHAFLLLLFIAWRVIVVIPYWKIYRKAGFSGWLALLMVIPLVRVVVLYIIAFSSWKTTLPTLSPYTVPSPNIPSTRGRRL